MKLLKWLPCLLLVAPINGKSIDPPTMGWSSWNTYRVHISDSLICRQADAMRYTGLQQAGYRYINIDDGYFGGRDANGRLMAHPTRFPNGLKPVVDYIHRLGFKAGIYSDAGRNTCGSYWDRDSTGIGVGFYGHDQQDAEFFFRDMGFDFIKVDFCGGDGGQNFDRLDLDERTRYTAIRRAIDATGRKDVRLNVCRWNYPGTWVHDIASSWRISQDINASWASVKDIINQNLYLSAYAGQGHYNDMDMLEIGRGLTADEEITHFGMWCIMSSPLLIGCDLTRIPPSSLRLLSNRRLIAVNQDRLGLQTRVEARSGPCYILAKDLRQLYGKERAVALYNPTDNPQKVSVKLTQLGYRKLAQATDLVDGTVLKATDRLEVMLPPHGTRLFRLKGKRTEEPTHYEAEHAWLKQYQELVNEYQSARYMPHKNASGGMVAGFLGNGTDNYMEWRDVYSRRGGLYRLTVTAYSHEERDLYIEINGVTYLMRKLKSPDNGIATRQSLYVPLQKGLNTIRMGNALGWAPDVDCFDLTRSE